jgi:hypothetical protein
MSRPSRHGIEEAKSPRDRRRCEQRWDYRHSKKSDRVFRKLNALALPGSAATGNLTKSRRFARLRGEHAIFRHGSRLAGAD